MHKDELARVALIGQCQRLQLMWRLGEGAEDLSAGLGNVSDACARAHVCYRAFADCYSALVAARAVEDFIPVLKGACDWLRVFLLGSGSAPLWSDAPIGTRDLYGGALFCAMGTDRWRAIGRLWQHKRGDGARTKKWIQALLTRWGTQQGLSKERQAEFLISEFPEYSSVESLCTALKKAAQMEMDVAVLEHTLHCAEGLERANQLYVPVGTDWVTWVCSGFVSQVS